MKCLKIQVQSGNVTITGTGTNHLIIDSKSNKSIINWDSFSVHKKGRVDFNSRLPDPHHLIE